MQVSQRQSDLRNEKLGLLFGEPLDLDQVAEQLPALDEFHDEVYP
jgi:hypothetical protein